jgi:predicted acetyltransferase
MNIKLVRLSKQYQPQLEEMLEEWIAFHDSNHSPYAIFKNDYHDFDNYLAKLDVKDTRGGLAPDSTFFALDMDRNIFVGAINIRHCLNEKLLKTGGHIGDGVRPSERRKGVATEMIRLGLIECKKLGIDRVLITCDKSNVGSMKSIVRNGGVLENEVEEDGEIVQRYWIDNQ